MSNRTLAALETTIEVLHPQAIWLDAFCVPAQGPARTACLRSMGTIYSRAAQVAAVLSKESAGVLEQIASNGVVDPSALLLLEQDDWVTRAWTYQEIANSQSIEFIAEGGTRAVGGEPVLNGVGQAIDRFKKAYGRDAFALRESHPRLDSLEDIVLDWRTAGYMERSAYQVMSAMDRRLAQHADDHFNAMLGAITSASPTEQDLSLPAPEYFIRVCEAKGDFSFIYTSAPRNRVQGRRWRPLAGPLPAVLPFPSYGDGQTADLGTSHLRLDRMCPTVKGPITSAARHFIETHLGGEDARTRAFQCMSQVGFSGPNAPVELTCGYFFPQRPLADPDGSRIFIAAGIRWPHGAPGIVVSEGMQFRDVGVFVGQMPPDSQSIKVD